jgi:hypothetical protein
MTSQVSDEYYFSGLNMVTNVKRINYERFCLACFSTAFVNTNTVQAKQESKKIKDASSSKQSQKREDTDHKNESNIGRE